ncbi:MULTISPECIES: hypothetical protein [unclassified Streptomyces]|uniref:hypothetical protein n=1 Tax=unclassified Streptomyces TaxID=2593676 RepID=UPI001160FE79|nr:hypothetical protein [Streptomyces sp. TSRI0281]
MNTAIHEPVMELLRAALDPASHRTDARSLLGLPTGRLIADAAYADADAECMDRLALLAAGISTAAFGLTAELAARSGQSPPNSSTRWTARPASTARAFRRR